MVTSRIKRVASIGLGLLSISIAAVSSVSAAEAAKAAAVAEKPKEIVIPKAVFTDDIKIGKDPFFPNSLRRNPKPPEPPPGTKKVDVVKPPADPLAEISLKGITGVKGKKLALISTSTKNYTIVAGEEIAVRTSEGQVRIKCVQIDDGSIVIGIAGKTETRELKLSAAGK